MGLLLPDPCDPHCPAAFKEAARKALAPVRGAGDGPSDEALRKSLLGFIADFSNWDSAANPTFLETARALVQAAYPDGPPLVVDPFAGGGSIPLEALRVGCETFASDLNPVACLILKVLLEDIPRHRRAKMKVPTADGGEEEVEGLAEAIRRVGKLVKARAEKELAEFYPPDPDGARPIAYLWARTLRCEAPNCGAEIPLARSFWLSKKAGRLRALRYRVQRLKGQPPEVVFEVFEPKSDAGVPKGTVSRGNATCPACGTVLRVERVRAQLSAQRGGADVIFDERGWRVGGARLLAVVTVQPGEQGRHYRLPVERDYEAVRRATRVLADRMEEPLANGLSLVPDEPLPPEGTLGFRVQKYGIRTWGDLFTARQKLVLVTLARVLRELRNGAKTYSSFLACAFNRVAMSDMQLTRWNPFAEKMQHTFGRQALPIVWDFAEVVPVADAPGNWKSGYELIADIIQVWPGSSSGLVQIADAMAQPLPDDTATIWFTDPPYYDAVPYADLSDFFFVWFRRTLPGHPLLRDPFDPANALTPKTAEIVQNEAVQLNGQVKDRAFFENGMARAFREGRRVLHDDGIGAVVFAHKTTEGWEALLSGLIRAGWVVTAAWPITTEMGSRLRARESAALSASVHLIIRPRSDDAQVGDWGEVLRELPERVGDWMARLQVEGIRGADLVFACIGPALEIFSRYSKVETAEGREVRLANYLEKIWEVVGRAALQQVLGSEDRGAGVLEEDARLTALFLWTLQNTNRLEANGAGAEDDKSKEAETEEEDDEEEALARGSGGFILVFDVVRRFAQPLGIRLPDWEGRVIETKKGVVRLLTIRERAKVLFGRDGADLVAERIERAPRGPMQLELLLADTEAKPVPQVHAGRLRATWRADTQADTGPSDNALRPERGATTLDRVHTAMLLQAAGRANALRALLRAEVGRGPDFLRLANALSTLYPKKSEEKRLLDAMSLALPR
jgi:putative DNA methylase